MKTEHTPTPLIIFGKIDKCQIDKFTAIGFETAQGPIAYVESPDHARDIIRAVNTHDALVEALRGLIDCPIQCDCTPRQQDSGHCAGCWFPGYIDRRNQALSALALLK